MTKRTDLQIELLQQKWSPNYLNQICDQKFENFHACVYDHDDYRLNPPSDLINKLPYISQEVRDAIKDAEVAESPTWQTRAFNEIIGLLDRLVDQVEEMKEIGDYAAKSECQDDWELQDHGGPAAGFFYQLGESPQSKCYIDVQEGRYDLVDESSPWTKPTIYGTIGRLPPKETAETIVRFCQLLAEGKIPWTPSDDLPNHAYQPLFDGDLEFVYIPQNAS